MKAFEQVILIVSAIQGLLLSIALFLSGWRKHKPAIYLAIVLFVFAIELLNAWAMGIGYHNRPDAFPFWSLGSYLLMPPSLWFFLSMNRTAGFRPSTMDRLWFLPGVLEISLEMISYYTTHVGFFRFLGSGAWVLITEYLPIVATAVVLLQAALLIGKPDKRDKASARFGKQQWILAIFIVLVLLWIADAIFQIGVYHIIEILLCAVLLGMGYIVYFSPAFFEAHAVVKQRNLEQFSGYDDEQSIQALKELFDKGRVFLRPRLTLEEISSEMRLPSRYISYLINHVHQCNFNQFVNTYRVKEVLKRMEDPQNNIKTLLGIALDAGFSSKSSFNTAFRSVMGEAPSTFLKSKGQQAM